MPRKLPWLSEATKKTRPSPAAPRKRSASPSDLVHFDLEDVHEPPRKRHASNQPDPYRELSSSPPPLFSDSPPVEYMKDGYAADDIFHMVEDEFYSTAQLFTRHIHAAEYVRLKKLHRSRGRETLARLARGTDGRTVRDRQLQLKIERGGTGAAEREMMRKLAFGDSDGEDEDDEEEWAAEPELKGLITGSQQSPYKPRSTRDVFRDDRDARAAVPTRISPVKEASEDDETTDDDDLDARRSKPTRARSPICKMAAPVPSPEREPDSKSSFFKQFTKPAAVDRPRTRASSPPSRRHSPVREKSQPSTSRRDWSPSDDFVTGSRRSILDLDQTNERTTKERMSTTQSKSAHSTLPVRKDRNFGMFSQAKPLYPKLQTSPSANGSSHTSSTTSNSGKELRVSELLAQRRLVREKKQTEQKRKTQEEDSIPTFLF